MASCRHAQSTTAAHRCRRLSVFESPPGSHVTVLSTVWPLFFHLLIHFGWSNALICLCSLKRWRVSATIPIVRWQPGSPVKAVISAHARTHGCYWSILPHTTTTTTTPAPQCFPRVTGWLLFNTVRLVLNKPEVIYFGWEATSAFAVIHLQKYASPHRNSGGWEMCQRAGGRARRRRKAAVIEHREMEAGDPMRS